MSVNNITNAYGAYTDWSSYNQNTERAKAENNSSSVIDKSKLGGKKSPYTIFDSGTMNYSIKVAMAELGLGPDDKVSFATLAKAREQMEEKFTTNLKAGLEKFGVEKDVDFRLVSDGNGGVSVVSSHPDKAKIEQYLKENPKLVDDFNKILTLSNIEEARKHNDYDPSVLKKQIQLEAMSAWFAEIGGGNSAFMGYAGSQAWFGTGINTVA